MSSHNSLMLFFKSPMLVGKGERKSERERGRERQREGGSEPERKGKRVEGSEGVEMNGSGGFIGCCQGG